MAAGSIRRRTKPARWLRLLPPQRLDIGAYNTCGNGCVYCYANHSAASARKNLAAHRPDGELLFGEALPGEKITERRFVSEAVRQSGLPGL